MDEVSLLTITETSRSRQINCCKVLREEFRWSSFGFDFPNVDVFYRSQWRWPRLVFVIFRLCLALYTGIFCILTIVYFPHENPQHTWVVWITNWSYSLLTCHEIYAAAIVLLHSTDRTTGCCCRELEDGVGKDHRGTKRGVGERRTSDPDPVPCYMKLEWLLFSTTLLVALHVTICNLLPPMKGLKSFKGISNHILNSVVVLLEFCISALPVRLLHVVYSSIFFTLFFLFSYIYWSFDHTGNVLYNYVDWDDPTYVLINYVLMGLVLPLVIQVIMFFMYKLRLFIFAKIYRDKVYDYEEIYGY